MQALPPEKTAADKYYVGYFDSGGLAAVLDLILGYPQEGTALIGFFMVDAARQGTGLGSRLVSEAAACLRGGGGSRGCGWAWTEATRRASHSGRRTASSRWTRAITS